MCCAYKGSGGSRGGARGARLPRLFWVKKEEMTEGKMAAMASKSLAQGLDPPLKGYDAWIGMTCVVYDNVCTCR